MADNPCGNAHALPCGLANSCPVPEAFHEVELDDEEIYENWQSAQKSEESTDEAEESTDEAEESTDRAEETPGETAAESSESPAEAGRKAAGGGIESDDSERPDRPDEGSRPDSEPAGQS